MPKVFILFLFLQGGPGQVGPQGVQGEPGLDGRPGEPVCINY